MFIPVIELQHTHAIHVSPFSGIGEHLQSCIAGRGSDTLLPYKTRGIPFTL